MDFIYFLRSDSEGLRKMNEKTSLIQSTGCFPHQQRHLVKINRIKANGFLLCLFEDYKDSIIIVTQIYWIDRLNQKIKFLEKGSIDYYTRHYSLVTKNDIY